MRTKKDASMTSSLPHIILLAVILLRHLVSACNFPEALHMDAKDPPWYSQVRADGSRDVEYYIRQDVMEVHFPKSEQQQQQRVRWKCSMLYQGKLLLKRQDHLIKSYYRCVQFVFRSKSVVQIRWSHETKIFDVSLCDDAYLKLDPWPLISYATIEDDYNPCPFSGGFDMKIVDSLLGESGCNLMMRPMRMEVECLGGEGVNFNFLSDNCLPDIHMYVKQRTLCLTHWRDRENYYTILRRNEDTDLWCLILPIHTNTDTTAYLFSDLACMTEADGLAKTSNLRFFTLKLHTRVFSSLCEDEYDHCARITCNPYIKDECRKSCGVCDLSTQGPTTCAFPKRSYGSWFLKNSDGYNSIEISQTEFKVSGMGEFQCVSFPESPNHKRSNVYTAVSLYKNGCRPRYTCVKFQHLGPSVLQYSLSQSYVWPAPETKVGETTCGNERFYPDPSPIDDKYHSHEGTGKPIISQNPQPQPIPCNLTAVHTISATLPEGGYVCSGSFYEHCEDPSKLRLEFDSCATLIPTFTDYQCLANFEGHYWERVILLQNLQNEMDAVCFVFSQFYPNEAYALVASQCDQKSFNFARTGLRQPLLKFQYRTETQRCKSVPVVTTTTTSKPLVGGSLHSDSSVRDDSPNFYAPFNRTNLEMDLRGPVSITVTGHAREGTYNDAVDVPEAPSVPFGGGDSLKSPKDDHSSASIFHSYTLWTVATVLVSLLLQ